MMTDLKESGDRLNLDEACKEFLESPHRDKLLTEFSLGSDKQRMQLYGSPIIMAKYSELIRTSINSIVASKPPHELFNFDSVLERPMTLLWLYLNGLIQRGHKLDIYAMSYIDQLNLLELVHLYRLCDYFGVDKELQAHIGGNILSKLTTAMESDVKDLGNDGDKKVLSAVFNAAKPNGRYLFSKSLNLYRIGLFFDIVVQSLVPSILVGFINDRTNVNEALKDKKNVEVMIGVLNGVFKDPGAVDWESLLSVGDTQYIMTTKRSGYTVSKGHIQSRGIHNLFERIAKYPAIKKKINYTAVIVSGKNPDAPDLHSYAERKTELKDLGKLNKDWYKQDELFTSSSVEGLVLYLVAIDQGTMVFEYNINHKPGVRIPTELIYDSIQPIIS